MRPAPPPPFVPALRRGCAAVQIATVLAGVGCASESPAPVVSAERAPEPSPTELVPTFEAMDTLPARRLASPSGRWEALVEEGGALRLRPSGGPAAAVDAEVDARLAFSPDEAWLVYARRGGLVETDLWRVSVPAGAPERLTGWDGSEDRPVLSPDGRRLAFVSGRTGIASWWVVRVDGALPVPMSGGTQLTNVGVKRGRPGVAPEGFVPPPDGTTYAWTDAGLEWVAGGRSYQVRVPE